MKAPLRRSAHSPYGSKEYRQEVQRAWLRSAGTYEAIGSLRSMPCDLSTDGAFVKLAFGQVSVKMGTDKLCFVIFERAGAMVHGMTQERHGLRVRRRG